MGALKVSIASPCNESWDAMVGTDRIRKCAACKTNVFNLEDLTEAQVRQLIRDNNGGLCVRLFKRPDGTVITRDCPVALARARHAIVRWSVFAVAGMASLCAFLSMGLFERDLSREFSLHTIALETTLRQSRLLSTFINSFDPPPPPPPVPVAHRVELKGGWGAPSSRGEDN